MEGPRHQHLHQEWQEPLEELFVQTAGDYTSGIGTYALQMHSNVDWWLSNIEYRISNFENRISNIEYRICESKTQSAGSKKETKRP